MAKDNKFSIDEFERQLSQKPQGVKQKLWKLIIPLNAIVPRRVFSLNLKKISVKSYVSLKKEFKAKEFCNEVELGRIIRTKQIDYSYPNFLILEEEGTDLRNTWSKISSLIEILRGIIDYSLGCGLWQYQSPLKRRTKVELPTVVYGVSDDVHRYIEFKLVLAPSNTIVSFDESSCKNFNFIIKKLKTDLPEKSTKSLIADVFRLYSLSMDSIYGFTAFLSFWQLAETISLSSNIGGKTEKVLERISWHLEPVKKQLMGNTMDKTLRGLAKKRNKLVHRGITDIDQSDINIIKWICEKAIKWLLHHSNKLRTVGQLEKYYSHRTLNKTEIKNIMIAIEHLER